MCTVNPYLIPFLNIDDTHNVPERSRTRAFHFLDELRVQVRQQVLPEELWRQLNELLHDTREEHDAKTAYALSHRHTHTHTQRVTHSHDEETRPLHHHHHSKHLRYSLSHSSIHHQLQHTTRVRTPPPLALRFNPNFRYKGALIGEEP